MKLTKCIAPISFVCWTLAGCSSSGDSGAVEPEPYATLAVVAGDQQLGKPGTALRNPVMIRVADLESRPIAGVTVTWTVTVGGGSIAPGAGVTDANGQASTIWTLGPSEGIQQLVVQARDRSLIVYGRSLARVRPIVFTVPPPPGDLLMMNPDGTDLVPLTANAGDETWPDWSPDGSRLAYLRLVNTGCSGSAGEVVVIDFQSMTETVAAQSDRCSSLGGTSWSNDGRIAFNIGGTAYLVNADGSGLREVPVSGAWSPVAPKVAFSRRPSAGDPFNVYVVNADGTGEKQLTYDSGIDNYAGRWSPDGSRLSVFRKMPAGSLNYSVWTLDPNAGTLQQANNSDGLFHVAWSPDGTQIMASTRLSGGRCSSQGWPYSLTLLVLATGQQTPVLQSCGWLAAWRPVVAGP